MRPFIGEIRAVGFDVAPNGWAFCDGQELSVTEHPALFSILGTIYGGDGRTTFALPNLQGRAPIGAGAGQGLSDYALGDSGGGATVTLTERELPSHPHNGRASSDPAEVRAPAPDRSFARSAPGFAYQSDGVNEIVPLAPEAIGPSGPSDPHNNMPPVLALNYIIALQGDFPKRP